MEIGEHQAREENQQLSLGGGPLPLWVGGGRRPGGGGVQAICPAKVLKNCVILSHLHEGKKGRMEKSPLISDE